MTENEERRTLLTGKGRLREERWAGEDVFIYNKERIRTPSRRREWESYQVSNDRFAFRVLYGHGPGVGLARATLVDFETGERYVSGKPHYFPRDGYDLDFSGGEPHSVKYEDDGLFMSIGSDGLVRRVIVRSDRFDAELAAPEQGDAMVTAVPCGGRYGFLYRYEKSFAELSGHVHMHKLDYPLTEDTFLLLSSGRGVLPYLNKRIRAAGAFAADGHVLGLNLGEDFARDNTVTDNALFLDGTLEKLGQVKFAYREEDVMKPWRISDSQRRLKLEFYPTFDDFTRFNRLAADRRVHRLYGKLYGRIRLSETEELTLEEKHFFIEYTDERW